MHNAITASCGQTGTEAIIRVTQVAIVTLFARLNEAIPTGGQSAVIATPVCIHCIAVIAGFRPGSHNAIPADRHRTSRKAVIVI